MAFFCAVLFPLDGLDEVWDVIESVSEGFLIYSCNDKLYCGIANGHFPICFSLYLSFFFLSRFFLKDISTAV